MLTWESKEVIPGLQVPIGLIDHIFRIYLKPGGIARFDLIILFLLIRENLGFEVEPAYGLELLQLEKGSTGLFAYLKPRIVLLCHYNLKKEGPLALIRRNIFRE